MSLMALMEELDELEASLKYANTTAQRMAVKDLIIAKKAEIRKLRR